MMITIIIIVKSSKVMNIFLIQHCLLGDNHLTIVLIGIIINNVSLGNKIR